MAALKDRPVVRRDPKRDYCVKTLGEVAEFFGVGITTVNQWRTGDNPMPGEIGRFDLAAIAKWDRGRRRDGGGLNEELKQAEIRLKAAQARAKELENATTEGELVPLVDVERWAAITLTEARERFMAFPEQIAVSMPPEHRDFVREEADRVCRGTLIALQRDLERDPVESDEVSDAAAQNEIG